MSMEDNQILMKISNTDTKNNGAVIYQVTDGFGVKHYLYDASFYASDRMMKYVIVRSYMHVIVRSYMHVIVPSTNDMTPLYFNLNSVHIRKLDVALICSIACIERRSSLTAV